MGTAPTVGDYRFDAWDLPTKSGWMHSGPGVQAATMMQDIVSRMANRMITSGELVARTLSGAQWAGAAASAAGRAMQRGASQIHQSAADAATAQQCITELGESFQTAKVRMPSPNEIPTGLGDRFLYGAAEGFNALSPFDVQSPLHHAMEQRRELDQQANLTLTNHMITSRDRVEAIPIVAPPAPMVVTAYLAAAPGGGVEQPARVVPASAGVFGGGEYGGGAAATAPAAVAPATTATAGWAGVPAPAPAGPAPVSTGPMGTAGSVPYPPRPSAMQPTGIGDGSGGAAFGPGSGGRTNAGGTAASGRAGLGIRPGSGASGNGIPSRGASGRDGPVGGPATSGSRGAWGGAAGGNGAGVGGGRAGAGSFMQSPVSGRGSGADDTEHRDRYARQTDHIIGELPLVAPAVIGETPDEQRHRLSEARDSR